MSFTTFTNIITIIFCLAVLVQSVRMMRSLKEVREGQLDRTVTALDTATAQARTVLSNLKSTLSTDGAANARALADAKEIREELSMMIGIANAMAERLVEAAATPAPAAAQPKAKTAKKDDAAKPEPATAAKRKRAPAKRTPAKRPATSARTRKTAPKASEAAKRGETAAKAKKPATRKTTSTRAAAKGEPHLKVVASIEEAA